MKIAGYCRVSTKKQARNGISIEMQKSLIKKEIDQRLDIQDYQLNYYIDNGYSSKSLNRPSMNNLIADIKNNKIDIIIAYDLSRLSRDVIDTEYLLELLMNHNIEIRCIYDNPSYQTAMDRYRTRISSINNALYRELTAEKTRDALKNIVDSGRYAGGGIVPFGYKRTDKKELIINEEEKPYVKKIFKLAIMGIPSEDIAIIINKEQDFRKFSTCTITYLLRNRKYSGHYYFRNKDYRNIIPAIITDQEQEKAMHTIRKHTSKSKYYIFKHVLSCDKCNTILYSTCGTGKQKITYFYYKCPQCNLSISQIKMDALVKEISPLKIPSDIYKKHKTELERRKINLNRKKISLKKKYLSDFYDDTDYMKLLKPIELELKRIENALNFFDSKDQYLDYSLIESKEKKKEFILRYIYKIKLNLSKQKIVNIQFHDK